jgi:pimeloyl-ACP methyl ester carboxylesterase
MLSSTSPTEPPVHLLNQSFTLPDNRVLGYAEYGDPEGYPLMFFHGFPSCRYEVWAIHAMVKRKQIRLIAPDRPGFGLSTYQPDRRIIDYASDISQLANHLDLDRFAIIGASGGGPYALACAKEMPAKRLSAVGLLASAGPWCTGVKGEEEMDKKLMRDERASSKLFASGVRSAPRLTKLIARVFVGATKWLFSQRWIVKQIDKRLRSLNKKKEASSKASRPGAGPAGWQEGEGLPGPGEFLAYVFKETFRQGTDSTLQEAAILFSPWGFDVSEISYDEIQLYHGTKDINAPINQIRYVVERLPHCTLKEYELDHFGMADAVEEVLDDLVTEKTKNEKR